MRRIADIFIHPRAQGLFSLVSAAALVVALAALGIMLWRIATPGPKPPEHRFTPRPEWSDERNAAYDQMLNTLRARTRFDSADIDYLLQTAENHPDESVRKLAMISLAYAVPHAKIPASDTETMDRMRALFVSRLDNPSWSVRSLALTGLHVAGFSEVLEDPEVRRKALAHLEDEHPLVRAGAQKVFFGTMDMDLVEEGLLIESDEQNQESAGDDGG